MAVDLDEKQITFYRNGRTLGLAYDNFDSGTGLYPAVSLSRSQRVTVNFGKTSWAYPPPSEEYRGLHCFLSEQQLKDLEGLFNKYKSLGVTLSESGETGDSIKGQGFLEYGKALGIEDDNDFGLFLLAYRMDATEVQLELQKEEFIDGWTSYGCASIDAMKKKVGEWREEVKQVKEFRKFYFFMFEYLKEESKTYITLEEAMMVWKLLGIDKKWALWDKWVVYLEKEKTKAVSRDTWRQFHDFVEAHQRSLDDYDEMSSWPVLMDGFYYYASGKEQGEEDDSW